MGESLMRRQLRRHFSIYRTSGKALSSEESGYLFLIFLRNKDSVCVYGGMSDEDFLTRFREKILPLGDCGALVATEGKPVYESIQFNPHTAFIRSDYDRLLAKWAAYNGEWRKPKDLIPDPEDISRLLNGSPPYPYRLPESEIKKR